MSKASQIRQKAQEFLSKGQIDKATQEYRRLLSIESKNPNLYNELGDILLRAGDRAQAVQNFEKASTIYEKVALYNNAVAVCKKILRIEPEKADTLFKLAELRAKQKLEGDAVIFFDQYVECVLANPQALLQRAQKDVERMLELMGSNESVMASAVEILDQLGLKLRTAELCSKIALMAQERGDAKKQMQFSRRADELKSGLSAEERGAMESSAKDGEIAASSPEAMPGVVETGESPQMEAGPQPPSEAAQPASEAPATSTEGTSSEIEDEPPDTGSSEPDVDPTIREAVEEAEMVAAISAGQEPFAQGVDSAQARKRTPKQRPSPARAREKTASAVEPEAPAPREASQSPDLATASNESSQAAGQAAAPGADSLAEEITSDVEKDDLKSHYDLGMAYLEMGLYTEAIKDFQIASRAEDLKLSSMEMIGYCFLKHNQPRLAVKQLTHALEIAKNASAGSLGIHYNLGLAHEMLGELDAAREHFEEVYIIDMAFRDVSAKMKKLASS